jgi:hypothetical protein
MIFRVTKQFSSGSEQPSNQFKEVEAAKLHAYEGASANAALKIKVIYRVYEFDDVIMTVDSTIVANELAASGAASSGGKSSGSSFTPSPFATTLQPKGTMPKWNVEDDKKAK